MIQFGYGERPGLKQPKVALNAEKNSGIPLGADILNGNRTNATIVVENLKKLN